MPPDNSWRMISVNFVWPFIFWLVLHHRLLVGWFGLSANSKMDRSRYWATNSPRSTLICNLHNMTPFLLSLLLLVPRFGDIQIDQVDKSLHKWTLDRENDLCAQKRILINFYLFCNYSHNFFTTCAAAAGWKRLFRWRILCSGCAHKQALTLVSVPSLSRIAIWRTINHGWTQVMMKISVQVSSQPARGGRRPGTGSRQTRIVLFPSSSSSYSASSSPPPLLQWALKCARPWCPKIVLGHSLMQWRSGLPSLGLR